MANKGAAREVILSLMCAAEAACVRFDCEYHAYWQLGTKRNHGILITMHGKNICDSLAVVINSAIQHAVKNDEIIDAGTRALCLWLAMHKQVTCSNTAQHTHSTTAVLV